MHTFVPVLTSRCTRSAHELGSALGLASYTQLPSGNWRVQVRRKNRYVSETFRRRKDGEDWALDMERNIDRRGSPKPKAAAPVRTFGDTIDLYVEDMHEVGRPPRPKANLERLLERRPEGVFVNAFEIGLMKRAAAAIGAR